ncbi:hypothetical protein H632_c1555p0 [Helicosporidium sp. ATCC 50920]|nr:hypothetical protein H632_c1555p0 [Helicosporidium sp. ATCC 50920]|eukprot:KDD74118.1 hypothetical protein H632_c1555p0 [Helicosporidium sp. ATCC 50920]
MPPKGGHRRKSLACYIQALEGNSVVVELQSEAVLRGRLASCDDDLNVQLEDVRFLAGPQAAGGFSSAPFVYVRGSRIRFIHVPGNMTPREAVAKDAARRRAALQRAAQLAASARLAKGVEAGVEG